MAETQARPQPAPKNGENDRTAFATSLRAEYDPILLDQRQRGAQGRRIADALDAAGVWQSNARILDVGCGSGLLLSALGSDARRRVGCDMRRALYVQAQPAGVVFAQGAAGNLPFRSGSFDLIICHAVLAEIPDWRAALEDMARCVAPGGILYVTFANARFLLPLYRVAGWLGRSVPDSFVATARGGARFQGQPREGFGVPSLRAWRFVDVTPHLARGRLAFAPPLWLIRSIVARFAPSFGFAWQRPA